jgi:hypothetical protein
MAGAAIRIAKPQQSASGLPFKMALKMAFQSQRKFSLIEGAGFSRTGGR